MQAWIKTTAVLALTLLVIGCTSKEERLLDDLVEKQEAVDVCLNDMGDSPSEECVSAAVARIQAILRCKKAGITEESMNAAIQLGKIQAAK